MSRKRRSTTYLIGSNDSDDIQAIEFLAIGKIEVIEDVVQSPNEGLSNEFLAVKNSVRLRRSVNSEDLNNLYSSVTESVDEIEELFEGTV